MKILVKYTLPRAFQYALFFTVAAGEMLSLRIMDLGSVTERIICRLDSCSTPVISTMLQSQKSSQAVVTLVKNKLFIEIKILYLWSLLSDTFLIVSYKRESMSFNYLAPSLVGLWLFSAPFCSCAKEELSCPDNCAHNRQADTNQGDVNIQNLHQ